MPTTPKPWNCPECGGEWIRNYTFRHKVNQCSILNREDATQAADEERLNISSWQGITRTATSAELELAEAIYGYMPVAEAKIHPADQPNPEAQTVTTHVARLAPGIRTRTIAGLNPDNA